MSTVAEKVPSSTLAAPALGEAANVISSGIVNKELVATDGMVRKYCDQIIAGKPTGKIFPSKLSEMVFTNEQREEIRGARAEHKLNCMNAKRVLLGVLRSKSVETVGHRTNKDGSTGAIRYAKREKCTPAFIYGAEPKNG